MVLRRDLLGANAEHKRAERGIFGEEIMMFAAEKMATIAMRGVVGLELETSARIRGDRARRFGVVCCLKLVLLTLLVVVVRAGGGRRIIRRASRCRNDAIGPKSGRRQNDLRKRRRTMGKQIANRVACRSLANCRLCRIVAVALQEKKFDC